MIEVAHAAEQTVKVDMGIWNALASANIVVQSSLALLIIMSIVSWAIIIAKKKQFTRFEEANNTFLHDFWKANSLDDIFEKVDHYAASPLSRVFKSGYLELRKMADSNLATSNDSSSVPLLTGIDNLERSLRKAIDTELLHMEKSLTFLATTGSSGPFIGLFGTVIGIMTAFQKIAQAGSANLAVVAPGISEALIATAVGLFAAIPASVAYNYYISRISREELELNNFMSDYLNISKRNFFRDK